MNFILNQDSSQDCIPDNRVRNQCGSLYRYYLSESSDISHAKRSLAQRIRVAELNQILIYSYFGDLINFIISEKLILVITIYSRKMVTILSKFGFRIKSVTILIFLVGCIRKFKVSV